MTKRNCGSLQFGSWQMFEILAFFLLIKRLATAALIGLGNMALKLQCWMGCICNLHTISLKHVICLIYRRCFLYVGAALPPPPLPSFASFLHTFCQTDVSVEFRQRCRCQPGTQIHGAPTNCSGPRDSRHQTSPHTC